MPEQPEKLDLLALKREAEQAVVENTPQDRPLTPREISFTVRYTEPDSGKAREAVVVSRIMNATGRATVARMIAQMSGGMAWESIPMLHRGRFHALAVSAVQLVDCPKWLTDWLSEDNELLEAVYSELEKHESFFFQGELQEGKASAPAERLAVISPLTPETPIDTD